MIPFEVESPDVKEHTKCYNYFFPIKMKKLLRNTANDNMEFTNLKKRYL